MALRWNLARTALQLVASIHIALAWAGQAGGESATAQTSSQTRHGIATGIFGDNLDENNARILALAANALAMSLKHHGVKEERVILFTESAWDLLDSTTQDKISTMWAVRYVESITCKVNRPSLIELYGETYGNYLEAKFPSLCTKLAVWNMTEFQKVLWMDVDTMAMADISHIFSVDAMFAAASDPCTQIMLNAGVMLLRPSAHVFEELREAAYTVGSVDGTDQGLLNVYFGVGWQQAAVLDGRRVTKLPQSMNAPPDLGETWGKFGQVFGAVLMEKGLPSGLLSPIQIVHFMGEKAKPWIVLGSILRLGAGENNPAELQVAMKSIKNFNVFKQWGDHFSSAETQYNSRSSRKDEL